MRTYVLMMPRPYRPLQELKYAIERGDLGMAVAMAKDFASEHERPINLDLALQLLPLVVAREPDAYDGWACRWLARWLTETRGVTIEQAAEIAGCLADLPSEPKGALEAIQRVAI